MIKEISVLNGTIHELLSWKLLNNSLAAEVWTLKARSMLYGGGHSSMLTAQHEHPRGCRHQFRLYWSWRLSFCMNFVTRPECYRQKNCWAICKPFATMRNIRSTISLLKNTRQGTVKSARRRVVSTNKMRCKSNDRCHTGSLSASGTVPVTDSLLERRYNWLYFCLTTWISTFPYEASDYFNVVAAFDYNERRL